ncbi:hypothetical protein HPB50_024742 [Hyalomma asiaticum]|uniref:Uncharacterized protein n=1 Tax=Hyalomma asiaticum TaxID=266040 RepID=A0ACB7SHS1_HYAAI|nr:hypothetical protein HPB50_024742 [Hyalomma asiaticum]
MPGSTARARTAASGEPKGATPLYAQLRQRKDRRQSLALFATITCRSPGLRNARLRNNEVTVQQAHNRYVFTPRAVDARNSASFSMTEAKRSGGGK